MPLFGVYGNNDLEREPLAAAAAEFGFTLAEPPLELHWAERRIVVVHDRKAHPELAHAAATSSCTATTTATRSSG